MVTPAIGDIVKKPGVVVNFQAYFGDRIGLVWSRWWKSREMLEATAGEIDSQGKLHLTATTWLLLMPSFWHVSPITSPNLHRDMS